MTARRFRVRRGREMGRYYRPKPWELHALRDYAGGMTAAELAAQLGKPLTTVKSALARARAAGVLTGTHRKPGGPALDLVKLEAARAAAPGAPEAPALAGGPFTTEERAALRVLVRRELAGRDLQRSGATLLVRLDTALLAGLKEHAQKVGTTLQEALARAVEVYLGSR